MSNVLTVKDLINSLQKLIEEFPECENYQIIYSHDDEGNEYQRVINTPTLCQIENPLQKSYRFLEVVGYYNNKDIVKEDCNAVMIN